ncbi:MAG: hypothetical protein ABIO24_10585, partial [Saprospiraceae bacterium]
NVTAVGGTLTCKTTSLILDGGSTTANAQFSWSGPAGYSSPLSDPSITVDGIYTLLVTGTNGCTSSTSATVALDTIQPGATAASTNDLDCDDLSTTLQGGSANNTVVYAWSGPNMFSSTNQNPTAMDPGTYLVTVTANGNGCTSTSSVMVLQDIVAPTASAVGDTLNCILGSASLTGNSTTTGVTYAWTGPGGYMSMLQNPNDATVAGIYTLTVTGLNDCTATTTTVVATNNNAPQVTLSNPATLTCTNDTLTVTGTITTPASGFTAVWSSSVDPNFTSTQPSIQVTVPAVYTYTVTNNANGCKSQPTVAINQNIQPPQAVTATGGLLDCNSPSIALGGTSSTTGVTYSWTGPSMFTSAVQNPSVTNEGTYTQVVTSNANGCTASTTTVVTKDPTVPDVTLVTDTITCKLPTVVVNATSTPSNVTYVWTGPGINGTNMNLEDPSITLPGTYTVTATATSGCTSSSSILVAQNVALPGATTQGDTLTCTMPTGAISATSGTTGVTYNWDGPGGFMSTVANPSVTLTGAYTVTITAANGCTSTSTTNVSPDASLPVLTVSGGTVSCKVTSVTLQATSTVPVTWNWQGPGGFTSTVQNPTAMAPGNYTVTATASNGCSAASGTTVLADTNGPVVSLLTPDELNCTTTQVGLSASVATSGNYGFVWTTVTGTIVSGANSPTPQVSQAGTYDLVVTDNNNGCTTAQSATVLVDPATPSGAPLSLRNVSCFGDTNGSVKIDSIVGGTAPFVYSIDNLPFSSASNFNSLPPGVHTIVIQDANGCEFETTATILEPQELIVSLGPDTTIHLGQSISISLDNIVNFPNRVKTLTITPPGFVDSTGALTPIYSFRYHATVVDSNGCKATDDRTIVVDKTRFVYIPNIFDPESTDNNLFMIFGGEDVVRIKSFQVFDRWGEVVHEYFDFLPNDVASAWDGRIRGKIAVPAVFVYYAEIEFKDGETELYKGDVLLKH